MSLKKVASFVGVCAVSLKAELASFTSAFKHLSKTLQDAFDDIQDVENILEEDDDKRICQDELTREDVEKSSLDNRATCKGMYRQG